LARDSADEALSHLGTEELFAALLERVRQRWNPAWPPGAGHLLVQLGADATDGTWWLISSASRLRRPFAGNWTAG
jgi:hypothetical protein